MKCTKEHRYNPQYNNLPVDQGGAGRHRCAGCAYEKGYEDGLNRKEKLDLDLDSLPESRDRSTQKSSCSLCRWLLGRSKRFLLIMS